MSIPGLSRKNIARGARQPISRVCICFRQRFNSPLTSTDQMKILRIQDQQVGSRRGVNTNRAQVDQASLEGLTYARKTI